MMLAHHPKTIGLPLESILVKTGDFVQSPKDDFGDSPRDGLLERLDLDSFHCPCPEPAAADGFVPQDGDCHSPPQRRVKKGRRQRLATKRQSMKETGSVDAGDPQLPDNTARVQPLPHVEEVQPLPQAVCATPREEEGANHVPVDAPFVEPASNPPPAAPNVGLESWPAGATTVMLRNIPIRYKAEELLAEVIAVGFGGAFDFFYLPIDFTTKRNRGYCFINFHTASLAWRFVHLFHRQRLTRYSSQKILEVSPALMQGFDANIAQYVRKDAQRIQNPWFRPMIFAARGR